MFFLNFSLYLFHNTARHWALSVVARIAVCMPLLLAGCGGGGGGSSNTAVVGASIPGDNVIPLTVDSGPAGAGPQANRLYTDVTLCQPGTSNCQTIHHVLVDTGSTGLRLIASQVSSALHLQATTSPATVACQQFLDGSFAWGPVVSADVKLGGKTIPGLPLQMVGDAAYQATASTCAMGTAITSVVDVGLNPGLGATGILGVGTSKEDCGAGCAGNPNNGYYFTCAGGCTGKALPRNQQLQNPVYVLSADNNGVVVVLPGLASGVLSAPSLTGSMVFGIGTQANNTTTGASAMRLSTSTFSGYVVNTTVTRASYTATMANSFLDTGSNGLYFGTASVTLPVCSTAPDFYCSTTGTTFFSATVSGSAGSARTFSFAVDPAVGGTNALFTSGDPVLPTLSGPSGDTSQFIWGLPFFYGRTVFIGFEGRSGVFNGSTVAGPYYAF
jgi:Protein of unknown function (DUF3443)